MARKTVKQIAPDTNVRCLKVYPVEGTSRTIDELKTVGIKLSGEQAIHLASCLLLAAQEWKEVDLTAYRLDSHKRKSDGTHQLTITSNN